MNSGLRKSYNWCNRTTVRASVSWREVNCVNSCCYIECTHRTWKALLLFFLLLSTHMLSVLKLINSRTFKFCQFSSWSYWEFFIFYKLTHPQLLWSPEFPVSSFPDETRGLTCFHLKMSIYTHICPQSESVTCNFSSSLFTHIFSFHLPFGE